MCMWSSNFFENALVRRVKRRICIRMVRFDRSDMRRADVADRVP